MLNNTARTVELKTNRDKTKILTNNESPQTTILDNEVLENVEQFTYLGKRVNVKW